MKTTPSLLIFTGSIGKMFSVLSLASLMNTMPAAEPSRPEQILERGIYSEETSGDLDAAIEAYRKVVADVKTQSAIAAEAQFRLGVCLYKKGDHKEAVAAFEKLAKDHPDQKELVAQARAFLAGSISLLPVPWKDGEVQHLQLQLPSGKPGGVAVYSVHSGNVGGRKVWVFGSNIFGGVRQWSRATVDAETFVPLESDWRHTMVGRIHVEYKDGKATVETGDHKPRGPFEAGPGCYENEQVIPLMRRLPLADGYTTKLGVFAGMGAGLNGQILPFEIKVSGPADLVVPAGTFKAFKVETNLMQTFWYSADANRYLLQFEAGGATGKLATVNIRPADGTSLFSVTKENVTVSVPNDWVAVPRPDGELLNLLDDGGAAVGAASSRPVSALPSDQADLKGFAKKRVSNAGQRFKNFRSDEATWTEGTIGGAPAIFAEGTLVEANAPYRYCAAFVISNGHAVDIGFVVPDEEYQAFKPGFRSVAETIRVN